MLQITLTFPSVAAARKALLELPENLFAHVGDIPPAVQEVATPKPEKPKATKPEPVKQETVATPITAQESAAPAQKAESSAPAVEYPVLQKAVYTLAGKSREAAAAVAATFGVKTFKELDQAKWGDALAAVNAKIAELEAA